MAKKQRGRNIHGILVLDKPAGESSNRSLQRVKHLIDARKAGHTGSLDPLATGVLPLCFGEATKLSQFLLDADKVYQATIKLGVKTDSGDSQGTIVSECGDHVTETRLASALAAFRGTISQVPSMYSALKHQGVPLYKLARKGQEVERQARKVTIHRLELQSFDGTQARLLIHCTKGTYVRNLADDLGDSLGVGAHVTVLRRLQSGPFTLDHSITWEFLAQRIERAGAGGADEFLLAPDEAVQHLEKVVLPTTTADFVRQGQAVIARHLPTRGQVRLYDDDTFFGIGKILDDGRVAPERLLNLRP